MAFCMGSPGRDWEQEVQHATGKRAAAHAAELSKVLNRLYYTGRAKRATTLPMNDHTLGLKQFAFRING